MALIWIIFIGIAIVSFIVQSSLKSKFEKYSKVGLSNGMTGREVAEKMLRDNGIYDVRVISTPGMLTDHFNPTNKTVNLSEGVYSSCSVAAAAVAAHECGHAVQHARAYAPLQMRSALVPVVQFSSSIIVYNVVDTACRYIAHKFVSSAITDRYLSFRNDNTFQFHHTSCGD